MAPSLSVAGILQPCVSLHKKLDIFSYLRQSRPSPLQMQAIAAQPDESDGMGPVQFVSRWRPEGEPLYHRRLDSQWHDMCAESLGMPKVALCFLTRGPMHQVIVPMKVLSADEQS